MGLGLLATTWLAIVPLLASSVYSEPTLSEERVVFQTKWGDIEFGFYPEVAPVTVEHIFKLVMLGAYQGNHIFRVDKGFVAQVADVVGGRTYPMNEEQKKEGTKNVPLEVKSDVKHVPGVLSMGRFDDPNSAQSSFSFLLGNAPHLDMQYTIFGMVTAGMDVLHKLEGLETRKEGIFVMPKERVTIHSTYWYLKSKDILVGKIEADAGKAAAKGAEDAGEAHHTHGLSSKYCNHLQDELDQLQERYNWQSEELHRVRHKCLPS